MTAVHEVVYLRDGATRLLARRYEPTGPGPFPSVLHVHGGVWNGGSRFSDEAINRYLAQRGILVFAIDFRQAPQTQYPVSIADVHYGIRWLKAQAGKMGSRPEWVGGLGVSSGGHQLLLAALRPEDPRYARIAPPGPDLKPGQSGRARLPYLVLCWPVTDPLARYRWAAEHGLNHLVTKHDAYWGSVEAMSDGNPQRILESGAHPGLPPALLVYGGADKNVPGAITERFVDAYRRAGGAIDVERFDGMPHAFINTEPSAAGSTRALGLIAEFIHRNTKGCR